MPITQRFGADGALLELAVKAGKQRAFNTRFAQGQQLVQQAQANQARLRALDLESERLRLQAESMRQSFATPTVQRDQIRRNPLTQSVEQSVAQHKQPVQQPTSLVNTGSPGAGSVSGGDTEFKIDEEGNITGTKGDEILSPQEIRQRGGFAQGQAPSQLDPVVQTKVNLVNQFGDLSEAERNAFLQTAGDPEESLSQFRNRLNQVRAKRTPTPVSLGQQLTSQVSLLRQQVDDIESQSAAVEQQLTELEAEPINVVGLSMGEIAAKLTDARRDGDIDKAVLLRRVLELREAKRQARVTEQSLISGLVQPAAPVGAAPQQGQTEGVQGLSDEELDRLGQEILGRR